MKKSKRRKTKRIQTPPTHRMHTAPSAIEDAVNRPTSAVQAAQILTHPVSLHQAPTPSALTSQRILYDAYLLERARTQWQFGDWDSLIALDSAVLEHHPDRAHLALLVAAGHSQQGDPARARTLVGRALEWGANRQLMARILASGVHNTLGRVSAINQEEARARQHFEAAIEVGSPGGAVRGLVRARTLEQIEQLQPLEQLRFPCHK